MTTALLSLSTRAHRGCLWSTGTLVLIRGAQISGAIARLGEPSSVLLLRVANLKTKGAVPATAIQAVATWVVREALATATLTEL